MSLLNEIRLALQAERAKERESNVVYLAPGMRGVLRNELQLPDDAELDSIYSLKIKSLPLGGFLVTRENLD